MTWLVFVCTAILGIAQVSYLLSLRYASSTLSTVIESIMYPVSEISYPTLTLCNNNRVNWNKYELAKEKFIPNADNETEKLFYDSLVGMEGLEFGSFDRFLPLANRSLVKIQHINLTELFEFVIIKIKFNKMISK